jgi:hypothetical protein
LAGLPLGISTDLSNDVHDVDCIKVKKNNNNKEGKIGEGLKWI